MYIIPLLSKGNSRLFHRNGIAEDIIQVGLPTSPARSRMTLDSTLKHKTLFSEYGQTGGEPYGAIISALAEGVLVHDSVGRIIYCNPSAERILGVPAEQMMGRTLHDPPWRVITEDASPILPGAHPVAVTLRTGRPSRNEILGWTRPDSTIVWLSINSDPLPQPTAENSGAAVTTLRDVTEQRRMEMALQESEEHLRLATEASHLGTWEVYPQSGKRVWSPAIKRLFGFAPDAEISNQEFLNAVHPEDRARVAAEIQALLSPDHGAKSFSEFRTLHAPGGQERWVASWGRMFFDERGLPVRMIGITQDITQRKKAEQEHQKLHAQLQQAQKMESIGRLAGGLAHDFNNLLTIINGYSSLAVKELGAEHPMAEPIDEIRKAGESAAALIRQLLAFSRKQLLRQEALDLNAMINQMAEILPALLGDNIEIRTALAPSLRAVSVDRGQIEQVIQNLAFHARDAMPRGGVLTIETGAASYGPSCPRCLSVIRPGEYVCITVRDTGMGMDEPTRQNLFEPFCNTMPAGQSSGLALATVHGVILQSGGHIDVESEPGAGTSFHICLPATAGIPISPERAGTNAPGIRPRGTETILLVEDQPEVRRFASGLLQQNGYEVVEAASAEEALSQLAGHSIDLLLTDVRLPRMNGCELAEAVRSRHPGARVLFMSGYSEEILKGHGTNIRGAAVIQKPFRPAALADKVRELLAAAPN